MSERAAVLGSADVDDGALAAMVAAQLGVEDDDVELVTSTAEVAPYDLEALTTAGRYWVRGTARHGAVESPYAFFVKVVQSWARSPLFQRVPEHLREHALAMVPWRREPAVYASDLGDRLPEGLSLPTAYAVRELDELSTAVWLEVVDSDRVTWDADRFGRAAYLLGRLAASPQVAPLGAIGDIGSVHRMYAAGRLGSLIAPALRSDELWAHPLVAATFDGAVRAGLLAELDRLPDLLTELDAVPVTTQHGDACTRNLLVSPGQAARFVLIDFGFWGRGPAGFDLGQLLMGEVQMGERPASDLPMLEAACLPAYVRGLHDEGCDVGVDVVRRAHALLMLMFSGFSAIPFEHLEQPPTPRLVAVARERAASARFILDLVAATAPP